MYKSGWEYDYQYDWVLKKQGVKINEEDYAGNNIKGNIAAAQGKDEERKVPGTQNKFVEERKENRTNVGAQVMNSGFTKGTAAAKKQPIGQSSTKPPQHQKAQDGWAKGQLPVAMQKNAAPGTGKGTMNNTTSNGMYGSGQR